MDIRKKSKTFGKKFEIVLSDKNNKSVYIPPGFAHGFVALEDDTIFSYKCTEVYNKESEEALIWNDKDLNIDWGDGDIVLSPKDLDGKSLPLNK